MDELIKQLLVGQGAIEAQGSQEETSGCCGKKVMIFALGESARQYFHQSPIYGSMGIASSVLAMLNTHNYIDLLFLEKLQYLFMYLTKFEATELPKLDYNHIVIFGLEELVLTSKSANANNSNDTELKLHGNKLDVDQIRICNLIFSIAYKTKRKHNLTITIVPCSTEEHFDTCIDEMNAIEFYWKKLYI
ncbi:hypothetical protein ACO0RG_001904 [Hanseniaspora osmophila]